MSVDSSVLSGAVAGMVRVSDARQSDESSQVEMIEALVRRCPSAHLVEMIRDLGRKRWQFFESGGIARLWDLAADHKIDWVIFDKAQRIGVHDASEMMWFLTEAELRGIRVFSVAEGELTKTSMERLLGLILGAEGSKADQKAKAQNVLRGQRSLAIEGKYLGAVLPHAYDRICRATDGSVRFRLIEESREENPKYVAGSKDPERRRWLQYFTVEYPGGHVEHRLGVPGKNKAERYDFAITVREDRIEVVRLIFRMFIEGHTQHDIARFLNQTKADPVFAMFWTNAHVLNILRNPIYGGVVEWRRTSSAIYSSISPDGQYESIEHNTRTNRKKVRDIPAGGRIRARATNEDLRIIDDATLGAAWAKLAAVKSPEGKVATERTDSLWVRPFLRCSHCGGPMRSAGANPKGKGVKHSHFRCLKFARKAYLKAGEGCVNNRVRLADIEAGIAVFLGQYGETVSLALSSPDPRLGRLAGPAREAAGVLSDLHSEMIDFVAGRLDDVAMLEIGGPGQESIEEAYRRLYRGEESAIQVRIDDLVAQMDRYLDELMRHSAGSVMRLKIEGRIERAEEEVASLKSQLVPLEQRIDQATARLRDIADSIKDVRNATQGKRGRVAATKLANLLDRIDVRSIENPHARTGGPRSDRITESLTFHPKLGHPIVVPVDPPSIGTSDESRARAAELYLSGLNLEVVARTLDAEGVRTMSGKPWRRSTLTTMLSDVIAQQRLAGRASRPRSRQTNPGDSGGT